MASVLERTVFGNVDLADPLFDSLKEQYKEFPVWFQKKADAGEPVYIVHLEGSSKLRGFIYLKEEAGTVTDVEPPLPPANRLKIGTLKIIAHGTKLGERILKTVFDHAIESNVDQVYVTVFKNHTSLIKLLKRYGFVEFGLKSSPNGEELVMIRDMRVFTSDQEKDFPFIHTDGRNFYLLAIYPEFHTRLFPDSILRGESEDIVTDVSYTNTIHKVYVTKLAVTRMNVGDVIVIYRTTDRPGLARFRSVATSICVVQEIKSKKDFRDQSEFIKYCLPHSVYSKEELQRWFAEPRLYTVKMTYNGALRRRPIRGALLDDVGIPEQPRWDLKQLTRQQFDRIVELGELNESLIIH
jgi:hypothetical protein